MSGVRLFQERDVKALAIILPYLVRYRWQVVLAFACLIAITATTLIVPILMKEIVDGLSREELQQRTGAPLTFAPDCKAINAPALAEVEA